MGVACVTLGVSLRKGRYDVHLQWDIMRKGPAAWDNLYGAGVMGMVDTIYSRDNKSSRKLHAPPGDHGLGSL